MRYSALIAGSLFLLIPLRSFACDPCAIYSASRLQGHSAGDFTLSVSEQYTSYDKASDIPENSARSAEYVRGYSTTQVALAYDFTQTFGAQVTMPFIARRFDEIENFRVDTDADAGIGDLSLVTNCTFLDIKEVDWAVLSGFAAGIKFPTGDTGVLRDFAADEAAGADMLLFRHHQIGGASGGRALTFGTGSYDYILGWSLLARLQRIIFLGGVQYTIRTEGDFDYEFADDLLWSAGPGYYLTLDDGYTAAVLLNLSGEYKDKDHLNGELVNGSQISNLYLGPQLLLTIGEKTGADIGFDFRVTNEDLSATVTPEARIRAAISYRFS